jgi:hypothetical protein
MYTQEDVAVKKFVYLFRGGFPTIDTQKEYVKEWEDWIAELSASNRFVSGEPFGTPGKVVSAGGVADNEVNDDSIGGYMVVNAPDQSDALTLAGKSPNIGRGGRVEVREALPL